MKLMLRFWLVVLPFVCFGQTNELDSLKEVMLSEKPDTTKLNAGVLYLSKIHIYAPDQAFKYEDYLFDLARKTKNKYAEANVSSWVGIAYAQKMVYDSALIYFNTSIKYRKESGRTDPLVFSYGNLGRTYQALGDYDKALENYFISLHWADSLQNEYAKATTFYSIAHTYTLIDKLKEAYEYFLFAKPVYIKYPIKHGMILTALGAVAEKMDSLDLALEYFLEALKVHKRNELSETIDHGTLLNNIAFLYFKKKEYRKAIAVAKQSIAVFEKIGVVVPKIDPLLILHVANLELKKWKKASHFLEKADSIACTSEDAHFKLMVEEDKYKFLAAKKNYRSAFEQYQKYITLKDSILSLEKGKAVEELKTKYQTTQKEKENQTLRAENAENSLRLKSKQFQLITALASAAILFLIFLLYMLRIRMKRQKQVANLKLKANKRSQKLVGEIVHSKHTVRYVSNKEALKEKLGEESQEFRAINDFYEIVKSSSSLFVMPDFLIQGIDVQLKVLATRFTANHKVETNVTVDSQEEKKVKLSLELQQSLYMIVQEAFLNLLKHAKATKVDVSLQYNGETAQLYILDNGVGYDPKKIEESTGYQSVYRASVTEHNGKFFDESREGKGTELIFEFPIKKKRLTWRKKGKTELVHEL